MNMKYTTLGGTGLRVSRLCIGCMSFGGPDAKGYDVQGYEWTLGYEDSKKIIDRAIDLGINFFDTADVYSNGRSEQIVGRAMQGRRNDVVLATKVGLPTGDGPENRGLGRKHVVHNVKRSLTNLRTDRVDLYQIHRWDYSNTIEEVLMTLTHVVRQMGAADYIGGSSMWAWQFAKALRTSDRLGLERFKTMQNHYNLAYREEEREMIPVLRRRGDPTPSMEPAWPGFPHGEIQTEGQAIKHQVQEGPLSGRQVL